jgi:hypothetical protein
MLILVAGALGATEVARAVLTARGWGAAQLLSG